MKSWARMFALFFFAACAPASSPSDDTVRLAVSTSPETAPTAPTTVTSGRVSTVSSADAANALPALPDASVSAAGPDDSKTSASACAEADVGLDLRAWPTNQQIDVARESIYEASKFREAAPKSAKVRVYPSSAYGFIGRIDAETPQKALAECAAALAAYLPGAPTRHPLDHSPVNIHCHPCSSGGPQGTQGLLQ